ncbi:N-acetylmuramoyl-L-alanine amidase-like domain-containing protein [Flagellimonas sp. 2504JD4-2]
MIRRRLFYFFLVFSTISNAQITYTAADSTLFYSKLKELSQIEGEHLGDSLVFVGKSFLNTPYVEKTLEIGQVETLVINLRGLDCTTFVENALAFTTTFKNEQTDFADFTKNLKTIRYRNGVLDGYPSRLHYFTDWIRNNEKKGLVKDITSELGGAEHNKAINFMGTHRDLYPFLKQDNNYNAILKAEAGLAQENLCILAQDQIENSEHLIQSGDIIALATSIKGLDVTHTGIAIRETSGRIHLLHASISGSVQITKEPLVDYLKKIKSNIGIIVARPTLLSP